MSKERCVSSSPRRPAACPQLAVRWLLVAGLGAAAAGSTAHAEWDAEKYLLFGFGNLSLRPRLEVQESYDSNLYYEERDTVGDLITRIRPGLTLMLGKSGENFSALTYMTEITEYASEDSLDYIGHIVEHRARFKLGRTTINGSDSLTINRTALGGTFSYVRRPVGLMTLRDTWRIDYEASPKTVLGLDLAQDYHDYEAEDLGGSLLADFQNLMGGLRAGYVLSDRIIVYPQFTYRRTELFPNVSLANSPGTLTAYGASVGAEGEFTSKLTGSLSGGYEIREYSDGMPVPNGWIADAALRWQVRAKTSLSLSFRHWITVAPDSAGTAYTGDRLSVGVNQQLGTQGRWTITAEGYLQFHDYGDGFLAGGVRIPRSDDLAGGTISSGYRWTPWLTSVAEYSFAQYVDNVPGIPNYDVHRFTLRLAAGF